MYALNLILTVNDIRPSTYIAPAMMLTVKAAFAGYSDPNGRRAWSLHLEGELDILVNERPCGRQAASWYDTMPEVWVCQEILDALQPFEVHERREILTMLEERCISYVNEYLKAT